MIKLILIIMVLIMHNSSFASKPISNLIIPVSYFVDHVKQLNDLENNLLRYRQASIVGTSDIGKTQLARTYAYEHKDQYRVIWFFDCNLNIEQEFVKLAKQLNQSDNAGLSEDPKLIKQEIMNYLSSKDKWLLVLDNLKVGDNTKVKDLIEWEHNGHVVFASQDKQALPHLIQLTNFNRSNCITLANNILENSSQDKADFLATSFNGYPILIVQTAQLLNQVKGLNLEKYKQNALKSADKIKFNIELAIKELKPSAARLVKKIALINNQKFSKELLNIITDDKNSVLDDIYQLSKFMLIANIDNDNNNPVFEMHDVIAQKIVELEQDKINKEYLEDIITSLVNAVPNGVLKGRIFRNSKTIFENFEIVAKNAERYKVDIYKIMELNSNLAIQYANSLDFPNLEDKLNWLNTNTKKFHLLSMNNDQRARYAAYLGIIGSYYRHRYADANKAIEYFTRSTAIFDSVKGYEFYKFNIICQLTLLHIGLGKIQESNQDVYKMEEMLNSGVVDKEDITFAYYAKTKVLFIQGQYLKALKQIDKTIEVSVKNGLSPNDLFLTSFYLLKTEILNSLNKYHEAYAELKHVYSMHKTLKKEDNQIFGRIYIQMARSEIALGKMEDAEDHVTKAMAIFLGDEKRNLKNSDISEDPDLAAGYIVQGDVFSARGDFKNAIESYRAAQKIYFYLYKNNRNNVAHVSDLYLKGAKAACRSKDLYHYKAFGLPQVREFGKEHPNTINMYEYCKDYNMDLWQKEN